MIRRSRIMLSADLRGSFFPRYKLTLKVRNCLMNPLRGERKLIPGTYSHICVYKKCEYNRYRGVEL